jgi:hypothetical protein
MPWGAGRSEAQNDQLSRCSAQGVAIFSGALTLALLEHLVEREVISRSEAQSIVQSSIECLEPRINVTAVGEAVRLMRERVVPQFD